MIYNESLSQDNCLCGRVILSFFIWLKREDFVEVLIQDATYVFAFHTQDAVAVTDGKDTLRRLYK